jgi:hypothetical protein
MKQWMVISGFLLASPLFGQTTNMDTQASQIAYARVAKARQAVRISLETCTADLSGWDARDTEDDRSKAEQPNWWYQKLSTEELVRLSGEAASCPAIFRSANDKARAHSASNWRGLFDATLLYRAEAVIADHHLMNDYLLSTSR